MHDAIGKRVRPDALVYPFIELVRGLAHQANLYPVLTNAILLVVVLIGARGVLSALHQEPDVTSACLGTSIKVPLSTVAIVEDVRMAVMAGVMLLVGTA